MAQSVESSARTSSNPAPAALDALINDVNYGVSPWQSAVRAEIFCGASAASSSLNCLKYKCASNVDCMQGFVQLRQLQQAVA